MALLLETACPAVLTCQGSCAGARRFGLTDLSGAPTARDLLQQREKLERYNMADSSRRSTRPLDAGPCCYRTWAACSARLLRTAPAGTTRCAPVRCGDDPRQVRREDYQNARNDMLRTARWPLDRAREMGPFECDLAATSIFSAKSGSIDAGDMHFVLGTPKAAALVEPALRDELPGRPVTRAASAGPAAPLMRRPGRPRSLGARHRAPTTSAG